MDFSPLKKWMQDTIEKGVPGCEMLVCRDHQVLFHECAGWSDEARTQKACPRDRYFLYSCTKPVTVTAAMQLLEAGKLELEAPVSRYLPGFDRLYLRKDGTPLGDVMKIRHLFTMTGGLDYDVGRPALKMLPPDADTMAFARAAVADGLDFMPGERFQYSLCHDVLGGVIEAAAGESLADFMGRQIFDPLGMKDTEFYVPGRSYDRLAAQYIHENGKMCSRSRDNWLVLTRRHYSGGAGLISTASDYARFADSLACDERLLQRSSIDRLRREELGAFRINGNFTCTTGEEYGYGLGVRTRVLGGGAGTSPNGEFGWDGAAGADLLVDPENRLSVVYVQHVLNWPSLQGAVHLQIRDLLYPILGL